MTDFYFICWEGEKVEQCSFARVVPFSLVNGEDLAPGLSPKIICRVLPKATHFTEKSNGEKVRDLPSGSISTSPITTDFPSFDRIHDFLSTRSALSARSEPHVSDDRLSHHRLVRDSLQTILQYGDDDLDSGQLGDELLHAVDTWTMLNEHTSFGAVGDSQQYYIHGMCMKSIWSYTCFDSHA
jgi:hypothetical protein